MNDEKDTCGHKGNTDQKYNQKTFRYRMIHVIVLNEKEYTEKEANESKNDSACKFPSPCNNKHN